MAELDDSYLKAWLAQEDERERGTALLAELREGRRGWHELDSGERRLASGVALVDLVLERCREARFEDPRAMVGWAEIGCELAGHLALDPNGGAAVLGVEALAWAELGNAYRVADDLERAAQALARSRDLALRGRPSSALLARQLELLASLCTDRREFAEASEILTQLEMHYRESGEPDKEVRVLLKLAHVHTQAHEPERAILVYLRALRMIPPGDGELLSAVHSLALNLVATGLPEAAQALIFANRRLYRKAGRLNQIRLLWLEGKIAVALDQPGLAETKLNLARLAFLHKEQHFDAALVSLDLALLLARQGRRKALLLLVEQMLATFRRLGIAREAIASLLLVKDSCEKGASFDRLCGQIEAQIRMLPELELRSKQARARLPRCGDLE